MNEKEIQEIYNYYYLHNIYTLINTYNLQWEFLDISNVKNSFPPDLEDCINNGENFNISNNKYLQKYSEKKIELAKDILENGMFFPFFATKDKEKIIIYLGKHRLYSLKLYMDLYPNYSKELLFIFLPEGWRRQNEIPKSFQGVFLFNLNINQEQAIIHEYPEQWTNVIENCDRFGSLISDFAFDYKLKPNKILNNKQAFIEFINNPLDIKNRKEENNND